MNELEVKNGSLDYKITNVVGTVKFSIVEKLDLLKILKKYPESKYNPEKFPGIVISISKPKATFLLFSTGSAVITGLAKEDDLNVAVKELAKIIKRSGMKVSVIEFNVVNIVVLFDLKMNIDLNVAAMTMENIMYEPEVFPGAVYHIREPKLSFLLFSTGKIICAGGRKRKDIEKGLLILREEVKKCEFLLPVKEEELKDEIIFI